MPLGLSFYIGRIAELLLDESAPRRYMLLDTASFDHDLRYLRSWVGLPATARPNPHTYARFPAHNRTYLSAAGRSQLRKHLSREYQLLERLKSGVRTRPLLPLAAIP